MNKIYIFHIADNQPVCPLVSGFSGNDFGGWLNLKSGSESTPINDKWEHQQ